RRRRRRRPRRRRLRHGRWAVRPSGDGPRGPWRRTTRCGTMTGGTGTASVRTRDPMSEPAHPRDRHPSQRRARAAPHAWAPAPALVAAILSVPVLVVAAALLVWRPDWRDVQPAVVIPWALLLAGAAALTGWHLTRHRAQLVASAEAATALALEREERLDLIVSSLHEGLLFQDAQLRIQEFN